MKRVGGLSKKFRTGRGTLEKIRGVRRLSRRTRTARGTLGEVRDRLGDPRGGPVRVG